MTIELLRHAGHDPYNSIYRYWQRFAEKYGMNLMYGKFVTSGGVDLRPLRTWEETMRRQFPHTFGKIGKLYKFRGRA